MVFALIIGILILIAGTDVQNVNLAAQQVKIVAVLKHDGWFPMVNYLLMAQKI